MKQTMTFAKKLRKEMTDTEKFLWFHLRRKQIEGFRFRRQAPIGPYIVDFVCLERRVVIELDGGQHVERSQRDAQRDLWLTNEGYRVLRFWDHEVFKETGSVLETILKACQNHPPPAPSPQGRGENIEI